MESIVTYREIKKVEYFFDKHEIVMILIEKFKLDLPAEYKFSYPNESESYYGKVKLEVTYYADVSEEEYNAALKSNETLIT